jgi:hypothetical protein
MTTSKECPKCGSALFWAEDIGSYCTSCGWKEAAKQTQGGPLQRTTGYVPGSFSRGDSGSHYAGSAEAPVGFNWGAFLIPFWWCLGMRLWGWAIALILVPIIGAIVGVIVTIVGAIAGGHVLLGLVFLIGTGPVFLLLSGFYLGAQGNELAWRSRPFGSVDEFMAVQRTWAAVGIVLFLAGIVLNFVEIKTFQSNWAQARQEMPRFR